MDKLIPLGAPDGVVCDDDVCELPPATS